MKVQFCCGLLALRAATLYAQTPSTNDLWDVARGAAVTAHSPLDAADGSANPFDAANLLGATNGTFLEGAQGRVVFTDDAASNHVHFIEFRTAAPVTVRAFRLFAVADDAAPHSREFLTFRLWARESGTARFTRLLYEFSPSHPYVFLDNASFLLVAANITPVAAQDFRAEFVTDPATPAPYNGPRVIELDGFGDFFGNGSHVFTRDMMAELANHAPNSTGVAWIDADNDGKLDLFASAYGGTNLLYRNTGSSLEVLTNAPLATDPVTSLSGVWGDFNNDGFTDLFVANLEDQPNYLYRSQGSGRFVRENAPPFTDDITRSVSSAWADYDNDGHLDLFVANSRSNQVNYLYRNLGDGRFSKVLTQIVASEVVGSTAASWSDFDNDGDQDLFVTSEGGSLNRLYRNGGGGAFTKLSGDPVTGDGGFSAGCAWGDFDNDGFQDLFVANLHNANDYLYRNTSSGSFAKVSTGIVVNDAGSSVGCSWGDFDNDGWLDLFVANYEGQRNALYRNRSDGTFEKISTGSIATDVGRSRGCAWGDYNSDGFLDLVVSNDGGFPLFLYRNAGNSNHWLKVRCAGTRSNRSAIGAKVRAYAAIGGSNVWQLREISGGTGYGSQNALEAHFGLASTDKVALLRIEWPSGIVQEFREVAVNQTLVVNEAPVLSAAQKRSDGSFEFTLTSRNGLSYRIEASTNLTTWAEFEQVRDVNGAVQVLDVVNTPFSRRFFRAVEIQ